MIRAYGRLRVWWLASILGISGLAFYQAVAPSDLLKTADEMVQIAVRLRGLDLKSPIQKGVKTRAEISQYIDDRVRDKYSVDELQQEGIVLKELGLIPPTMAYKDFVLKLLTEQVGGLYDSATKVFYIASWLPVDEQKPVMIHELTHALQDQHFDLDKVEQDLQKLHNDDQALAREAVAEGDAVAVMMNYILEPQNRNFASLPNLAFVMRSYSIAMGSQFNVFRSAPAYLQETLLFPYGYGAAFLQKVWDKTPSWSAVDKIYSDLPLSTEQIMHPGKYLNSRDDPKPVDVGDPAGRLGVKWKIAYKNVLGEFSMDLMLKLYLTEKQADAAAAGWGGDQVLLLEDDSGKRGILIATVWDTATDADEFYQAIGDWFAKRSPVAPMKSESPDEFSILHEGKVDAVRREGSRIQLIIGFPEADGLKLIH
jgi:hypothetical protein